MIKTVPPPPSDLVALVEAEIIESLRVKESFLEQCAATLAAISIALVERLQQGGKLLIFGNGGSAADAQHIAAEFVGRYRYERSALPALALTVNTSTLTSIANDYGYEEVFARQLAAFAKRADVAVGISTSGKSPSVIRGLIAAQERGILAVALTGNAGGALKDVSDLCLCVPSDVTARIQECHILAGHIISGHCERALIHGGGDKSSV